MAGEIIVEMYKKSIIIFIVIMFFLFIACSPRERVTEQSVQEHESTRQIVEYTTDVVQQEEPNLSTFELSADQEEYMQTWEQNRQDAWEQANPQYDVASNFIWELSDDGVTIIGFTGTNIIDLRIPPQMQGIPVINIGDFAFIGGILDPSGFTPGHQIVSVNIPDSVINIGRGAFANNLLSSVSIPDSVVNIGGFAFSRNQITDLVLHNGVTVIGERAFDNNLLTSVVIPDSVTSIERGAFLNNQLSNITIGDNVTHIGAWSFIRNLLTSINIPDSVSFIDFEAFAGNKITEITIGSGVDFDAGGRSWWNAPGGFGSGFGEIYRTQRRMAGNYTYSDGEWSFQPR